MARTPILAAGGIVFRGRRRRLVAVVQRRKDNGWVLPKGKIKRKERAIAAARREVLEETGHSVFVHDFLGVVSYTVGGRPKIVQFWKMEAIGGRTGKLMDDVKAVEWLPPASAIKRLSRPIERAFLQNVHRRTARLAARRARKPRPQSRISAIARKARTVRRRRIAAQAEQRFSRFRQIMVGLWNEPLAAIKP
jgi:8-oxo-dGTP diphosphatase